MTIKVTVPNTSNDSLTFGSANTPTAAQVVGIDSGSSNGQLAFNTTASGVSTERMRIDTSGNVGIGTASPASILELKAATPVQTFNQTTSNSNQGVEYRFNGTAYGRILNNATTGILDIRNGLTGGAGYVVTFSTDGSERARIDSSGNLLVGTTSVTVNPGISLQPSGRLNIGRSNDDAVAEFYRSGTRVGQINVTTTATSYITSSDYRLKEAIAPMTGALEKVALLKPCTYKWKVDGSDGQGFIAHELAEVEAGCVTGEKDAMHTEQYESTPAVKDEEGNIVIEAVMGEREVPAYQGIDTSFLVATLTAAIQELKAEVDALKAQVEAK